MRNTSVYEWQRGAWRKRKPRGPTWKERGVALVAGFTVLTLLFAALLAGATVATFVLLLCLPASLAHRWALRRHARVK